MVHKTNIHNRGHGEYGLGKGTHRESVAHTNINSNCNIFLGFANFYRKFMKNLSSVALPLHSLTSLNNCFIWTMAAEEAFQLLKEKFTAAPVLTLPDPKLQFVVEVDTSDVGAVLSQRSAKDGCLHPCAFLSRNCPLPSEIMTSETESFWQ